MVWCLFFGELSNPFNILRIVLAAQERTKASALAGMLFAPVYLTARLIFCTAVGFFASLNPNISYVLKVDVSLMRRKLTQSVFVSYVWVWKILNLGAKQFANAKPNSAGAQKFHAFMKSLRQYENYWNAASFILPSLFTAWSIYYDMTGWPVDRQYPVIKRIF
jgi:hypothetical protein